MQPAPVPVLPGAAGQHALQQPGGCPQRAHAATVRPSRISLSASAISSSASPANVPEIRRHSAASAGASGAGSVSTTVSARRASDSRARAVSQAVKAPPVHPPAPSRPPPAAAPGESSPPRPARETRTRRRVRSTTSRQPLVSVGRRTCTGAHRSMYDLAWLAPSPGAGLRGVSLPGPCRGAAPRSIGLTLPHRWYSNQAAGAAARRRRAYSVALRRQSAHMRRSGRSRFRPHLHSPAARRSRASLRR